MATAIMEAQLRDALNADRDLTARGAKAAERQPSGVAIERGPNVLGIWHWRRGQFELTIGGSGPVVTVETVAEAVRYTRERLAP
jgi:hypothetical protein